MAIFKESKAKTSIVVTLTALFVCIGVIPLLFSNWKLITLNREELESNLQESFLATVTNVSSWIANYLREYRIQVREFAPKAYAELNAVEDKEYRSELPSLMKDPNIARVRILNSEGKGSYAQRFSFQDSRVPDLEYEAFSKALQGEPYIGSPYYDKEDDIAILLLAEPLRDPDENTVGVLLVIVSLKPVLKVLESESSGGDRGTKVYVVDAKGNLLLHPKVSEMMERKNLSGSAIVSDFMRTGGGSPTVRRFPEKAGEILGAYVKIGDLNWGIIIQIETDIAFASVDDMIMESMKWGVLFALAAALVGIFLARWITSPIKKLADHAMNIGRHQKFDEKIQINASNEIQQLADTFNFMTDEIKQYILSLQAAIKENKELFLSSIRMLSAAIDAKDPYTRGHSERVKEYTLVIGKQLGLNAHEIERLEIAALLHDVGKIGIEDRILRKPTNLTPEEFEIMKTHPDKGANIMGQVAQLQDIIPGMRGHHENFDGSGYPQGLKAEEIPLFARIITVADTFDAMTTDRPYQKAFTLEFALNRIRTMAMVKYDPKIVEAFSSACEEGKITLHKPARPRPKQQPVA